MAENDVKFDELIDYDTLVVYDTARTNKNDQTYETKTDAASKVNKVEGAKAGDAEVTVDSEKNLVLGSAAAASTSDFDPSGAAADVLGKSTDGSDADTVFGAKKYAEAQKDAAVSAVTGADTDTKDSLTLKGLKKAVDEAAAAIPDEVVTETELEGKGYQTSSDVETAIEEKGYQVASELGTAAKSNTASTLADDATLPTGAAVKTFVENEGYQDATAVDSAIDAKGYKTEAEIKSIIEEYGYQNATQVANAAKAEREKLYKAVNELPATGEDGFIYLVPNGGSEGNALDEYAWVDSKWELFGTLAQSLDGYVKEDDFSIASREKVLAIVNGTGE